MTPIDPAPPFFSVITVCFDNLEGLKRTEASLRAQDCRDVEWIIVDGASRDGTPDYLRGLPADRTRFVSEPDKGIYDAMGKGLRLATGTYVIFMNSGDVFAEPDVLSTISAAVGADRPDVVYGDSYEQDGARRLYKPTRDPAENSYVMFTHHQSIFYRREQALRIGFDPSYRISGDWVMTGRMLKQAAGKVRQVPIPISTFERGGVSQSATHRALINREHFRIYREEHGHPFPRAAFLWGRKVAINKLREWMPGLYDRLRYRSTAE